MSATTGKNILIGVTGGIAAYKVVEVASRLKKSGANVRVVMTKNATEFISPKTFREITGNPVAVKMFAEKEHVAHITLADFADLVLIAPATANFLAKAAHGIADDLLSTTILATTAPKIFCPSMNTNMLENPATQENLNILKSRGIKIIDSASGLLACGVTGKGRLPEPVEICKFVENFFAEQNSRQPEKPVEVSAGFGEVLTIEEKLPLAGKKIIVTAGGTMEPIDPVRYICNRSTGKMGFEIAKAAKNHGAEVLLISGNSTQTPPENLHFQKVESAEEMRRAVLAEYEVCDAVIMSAAVSDYRVKNVAAQKIKKSDETLTLELVKNPDILKELGKLKEKQILIGFAAETENLLEYAERKLREKNLDMIVANDVAAEGAGFAVNTNIASFIHRDGKREDLPKMSKSELAEQIVRRLEEKFF